MKSVRQILVVLVFLLSLNGWSQEFFATPCDTFLFSDIFKVSEQEESSTHIFNPDAIVYCSPDLASKQLGALDFNTVIHYSKSIYRTEKDSFIHNSRYPNKYNYIYHNYEWFKINFNKQTGYIRSEDCAADYQRNGNFLIKRSYSSLNGREVIVKAIKGGRKGKNILDEHRLSLMHGYSIREIKYSALKFKGRLFCYETYRESCPGATAYELFVLNGKGFTSLITRFGTGEAGTFDQETIYFPVETIEGEIILAPLDLVVRDRGEKRISIEDCKGYPYPENLGVPIENIIIKTRSFTEEILDHLGNPVMIDDYEYKVNVLHDEPLIYSWNEKELELLGTDTYVGLLDSLTDENESLIRANKVLKRNLASRKLLETNNKSLKYYNPKTNDDSSKFYIGLGFFLTIGSIFYLIRKKKVKSV